MPEAVIVSAVRTPIATARKGSLSETSGETLARIILAEAVKRSGLKPEQVDDAIFAESQYGGGVLARHAAVEAGLTNISGQSVNRHCAGSLTSVGNAAASIRAGMDRAIVAGGVHTSSMAPRMTSREPGTENPVENWRPPSHPDRPDAPNSDMSWLVGWNTAKEMGITREDMDAWALRSHQRAVAAQDAGYFDDEIVPVNALQKDGSWKDFAKDEHPRRDSSMERLASLKVIHPEIDGFNITAGNASGVNDAASALMIVSDDFARENGLEVLGKIKAWASVGVDPYFTGMAPIYVIPKVLDRAGVRKDDVKLWEINEAFASVPIAAVRKLELDEDKVNVFGSGCSLGHPIAATGGRMLATLTHDLRRRGGGVGLATMCAGGGMAGAVVIEV
jgi:acetyl-CoA C-acetyltransferase